MYCIARVVLPVPAAPVTNTASPGRNPPLSILSSSGFPDRILLLALSGVNTACQPHAAQARFPSSVSPLGLKEEKLCCVGGQRKLKAMVIHMNKDLFILCVIA